MILLPVNSVPKSPCLLLLGSTSNPQVIVCHLGTGLLVAGVDVEVVVGFEEEVEVEVVVD